MNEVEAAAVVGAASQHVHPSLRRRISTCAALPVRRISDPSSQHLHVYGTMPHTRPAREGTIPSDEADLRFMDDRRLSLSPVHATPSRNA